MTVEGLAWTGTNPLNFLSSLGVVALLGDIGEDAALAWEPGLWTPSWSGPESVEDLAELILRSSARWQDYKILNLEEKPPAEEIRVSKSRVRELLSEWSQEGPESELLQGFFCETQLRNDGDTVQGTWFHFLAGRMRFLKTAQNLLSSLTHDLIVASLRDGLVQDVKNSDFLWDAVEGTTHAYRAKAPTDSANRVDAVANWCALQGLRLLPCVPRASRQRVAGFRSRRGRAFVWPLWRGSWGRRTIQSVLAQLDPNFLSGATPKDKGSAEYKGWHKQDARLERMLGAYGCHGLLSSSVVKAGKNQRFTPGAWIRIVDEASCEVGVRS